MAPYVFMNYFSCYVFFNILVFEQPVVLHDHSPTIEDFCNRLHKQMISQLKYAWVWGSSVRHQPQKCGKDHLLNDEDVVQIVKKI